VDLEPRRRRTSIDDNDEAAALRSLTSVSVLRAERVAEIRPFSAVVLVGGTCAGKSTLADAVTRDPRSASRCALAVRCTTRAARAGDEQDSVRSVTRPEFEDLVRADAFVLSWERPMQDGSRVGYGCMRTPPPEVPILTAGHGVYTNPASVRPEDALTRALVVGVFAPSEVRAARLRVRSPDVVARGDRHVGTLLAHDDDAMLRNVDIVVDNHGALEDRAVEDFIMTMDILLPTGPERHRKSGGY
jgi:ribose 1,5-bisphosphokinase PhnN